jgi:hypothetical protein
MMNLEGCEMKRSWSFKVPSEVKSMWSRLPRNRNSVSGRVKMVSSSAKHSDRFWVHPASYSVSNGCSFLCVKRAGPQTDTSVSAKVKNAWSPTPHPHTTGVYEQAQEKLYFFYVI